MKSLFENILSKWLRLHFGLKGSMKKSGTFFCDLIFASKKFLPHLICLLLSIGYISLSMHLPVSLYTYAKHDDALYWTHAQHILNGNWLGPYTQMTLSKGPGFSFFLAINYIIGFPITLSIALFYLFACWLLTNSLRDLGLNKYIALILFSVLLFHPQLFPTRIIRDNIYPALTLIVIAGVIKMMNFKKYENYFIKLAPYGLAFGVFWLTREEGFWIIPGILLLLLLKIFQLKIEKKSIECLLNCIIIFSVAAYTPVLIVSAVNFIQYGKFEIVDINGAQGKALKRLNSVDIGQDLPYLPVSFEKRKVIYNISPSFLQLKDFFENIGKGWTKNGCNDYPHTCDDYTGGWFMWAFRDAVYYHGYYESPVRADNFYNDISAEIDRACKDGLVNCKRNPIPFMPNVTTSQLKEIPGKFIQAFKLAMFRFPVPPSGGDMWGTLDQLQAVRFFLGNPKITHPPDEKNIQVSGWYYSSAQDWIILECPRNGTIDNYNIERLNSPDIAKVFKDPNADFQRFSIIIQGDSTCNILRYPTKTNKIEIVSLLKENKNDYKYNDGSILYFDNISEITPKDEIVYHIPFKIKKILSWLYKIVIPTIVFFGIIGYLFFLGRLILKRRLPLDLFFVATMLWFLFISRIGLLVLVDISSFPAINPQYASPAFPILSSAALLSAGLFLLKREDS
jgi:hypothetical protein